MWNLLTTPHREMYEKVEDVRFIEMIPANLYSVDLERRPTMLDPAPLTIMPPMRPGGK